MSVTIPDNILRATGMTPEEMKLEIALILYAREKLTLAQASAFCGITRIQFQHALADHKMHINYDIADFESDLETLESLDQP